MSGIVVVAFVVICGPQLLYCEEFDTNQQVFKDMGACQTKLDQIIVQQQKKEGSIHTVLGRCHYLLQEITKPKHRAFQQSLLDIAQAPGE